MKLLKKLKSFLKKLIKKKLISCKSCNYMKYKNNN